MGLHSVNSFELSSQGGAEIRYSSPARSTRCTGSVIQFSERHAMDSQAKLREITFGFRMLLFLIKKLEEMK
jgi:hypothetical protein